jgi:outer membrane immunogenic protein
MVGGQIGYRWQVTNWVFGLEAQGDWADLTGSNTSILTAPFALFENHSKVDAIGLFTGQIGYAWNNVLWYAKGGAAVTHDKYQGQVPILGSLVFDTANETRWGGVVGTGIEIGFAPGWSVGFEYDHLFMGTQNYAMTSVSPVAGANTRNVDVRQDADLVTVRVNYRFGGPVVARY